MRRVLLALPGAAVLVVAGLLFAHGATWSLVVGGVLGVGGVLVVAAGAAGRGTALYGLVGAVLLCVGTAAAASGLWLVVLGRDATATATGRDRLRPDRSGPLPHRA